MKYCETCLNCDGMIFFDQLGVDAGCDSCDTIYETSVSWIQEEEYYLVTITEK